MIVYRELVVSVIKIIGKKFVILYFDKMSKLIQGIYFYLLAFYEIEKYSFFLNTPIK